MRWLLGGALLLLAGSCATTERERTVEHARALVDAAQRSGTRGGSLRLQCTPEDAEVRLDGVELGKCSDFSGRAEGLHLGEGLHRVDVSKSGFWPYQSYLEPSGARATLHVALRPLGETDGASQ